MSDPQMLWVNPKTGEVVEEFTDGAIEVEVQLACPPETYGSSLEDKDFGDWLSQELVELEALEVAHKVQTKRRAAQLKARRHSVEGFYPELEQVAKRLLTGKKRSVDFAFGRAGFRKSRKVEVVDATEAMTWADEFCPSAIKVVEPTILVSMLPKGEEIPGVKVTEGDTFSLKGAK